MESDTETDSDAEVSVDDFTNKIKHLDTLSKNLHKEIEKAIEEIPKTESNVIERKPRQVVKIQVPKGSGPGKTLIFSHPHITDHLVVITVPEGITEGMIFAVDVNCHDADSIEQEGSAQIPEKIVEKLEVYDSVMRALCRFKAEQAKAGGMSNRDLEAELGLKGRGRMYKSRYDVFVTMFRSDSINSRRISARVLCWRVERKDEFKLIKNKAERDEKLAEIDVDRYYC